MVHCYCDPNGSENIMPKYDSFNLITLYLFCRVLTNGLHNAIITSNYIKIMLQLKL